jgi:hypothetical protein
MDKELIKRLAMQAGEYTNEVYVPPVRSKTPGKIWEDGHVGWHDIFNEKFAGLVAEHERERVIQAATKLAETTANELIATEREACAKVCEEMDAGVLVLLPNTRQQNVLAAAIRARGNHA